MKNCPNCGAVITDNKCSYCGTIYYELADLFTLDEHIIGNLKSAKMYVAEVEISYADIVNEFERNSKGKLTPLKSNKKRVVKLKLIEN